MLTEEAMQKATEAAHLVGLAMIFLKKVPLLFLGDKCVIAGILASNPDVLILDEPTVGLDPFGKGELLKLLKFSMIIITMVVSKWKTVIRFGFRLFMMEIPKLYLKNEELMKHNLDYPELMKLMHSIERKARVRY